MDFLPRRLSKYLSESTSLSHRQIRRAHERGAVRVRLSGEPAAKNLPLSATIMGQDTVLLDGREVTPHTPSSYLLLNKPAGVVSTACDPQQRACLVPWLTARAFPVGRLDAQTTGAILLTDDGDLTYMMLHPLFHLPKTYHLRLGERLDSHDPRLQLLREGVDIGDGKPAARALDVRVTGGGAGWTGVRMTLEEGRHRQVRRMCRAARLALEHLHRVSFGPVRLGGCPQGEVRQLGAHEIAALWEAVGGAHVPRERAIKALERRSKAWREQGNPDTRLERWLLRHNAR